jgi:hypothetical protein
VLRLAVQKRRCGKVKALWEGEVEWKAKKLTDWEFAVGKIDVVNRDYHHLSQFEIGRGKRISRHYSVSVCRRCEDRLNLGSTRFFYLAI